MRIISLLFSIISLVLISFQSSSAMTPTVIFHEDMESVVDIRPEGWTFASESGSVRCDNSDIVNGDEEIGFRGKAMFLSCIDGSYLIRNFPLDTNESLLRLAMFVDFSDISRNDDFTLIIDRYRDGSLIENPSSPVYGLGDGGIDTDLGYGTYAVEFNTLGADSLSIRLSSAGATIDDIFLAPSNTSSLVGEMSTNGSSYGFGTWFQAGYWDGSTDEIVLMSADGVSVSLDGFSNEMLLRLPEETFSFPVPLLTGNNDWHHVGVWISSSSIKVFVNAVEVFEEIFVRTGFGDSASVYLAGGEGVPSAGGLVDFSGTRIVDSSNGGMGVATTAPLEIFKLYGVFDDSTSVSFGTDSAVDGEDDVSTYSFGNYNFNNDGSFQGSVSGWIYLDSDRSSTRVLSIGSNHVDVSNLESGWHHVFATWGGFSGNSAAVYVDGNEIDGSFSLGYSGGSAVRSIVFGPDSGTAKVDEMWISAYPSTAAIAPLLHQLQKPSAQSINCSAIACNASAGDSKVNLSWCSEEGRTFGIRRVNSAGNLYDVLGEDVRGTNVSIEGEEFGIFNDQEYTFYVLPQDLLGQPVGDLIECNAVTPRPTSTGGGVHGSFYNDAVTWFVTDHFDTASFVNFTSEGCMEGSAWNNQLGKVSFGGLEYGDQCPQMSDGSVDFSVVGGDSTCSNAPSFGCPVGCQSCMNADGTLRGFLFLPAYDPEAVTAGNANDPSSFILLDDSVDPTADDSDFLDYGVIVKGNGVFAGRAWSSALGWMHFEPLERSGQNLDVEVMTTFGRRTYAEEGQLVSSIQRTAAPIVAVTPQWQYVDCEGDCDVLVELSIDGGINWFEVENGQQYTAVDVPGSTFGTDLARQLQYRITLYSDELRVSTPEVYDITVNYILTEPIVGGFNQVGFGSGSFFEASLTSIAPTVDGRQQRAVLRDISFGLGAASPWQCNGSDCSFSTRSFDADTNSVSLGSNQNLSQFIPACLFANESVQTYEFSAWADFSSNGSLSFQLVSGDTTYATKSVRVSPQGAEGEAYRRMSVLFDRSDFSSDESICDATFRIVNTGGETVNIDRVRGVETVKNVTRGVSGQKDVRVKIDIFEDDGDLQSVYAYDRSNDLSVSGTANPFLPGATANHGVYPGYLIDPSYADYSGVTVFYDAILNTDVCLMSNRADEVCWEGSTVACAGSLQGLQAMEGVEITEGERQCFALRINNTSDAEIDVALDGVISDIFFDQEDIERGEEALAVGFKEITLEGVRDSGIVKPVSDSQIKDRTKLFKGYEDTGDIKIAYTDDVVVGEDDQVTVENSSEVVLYVSGVPYTDPKLFSQAGRFDTELSYTMKPTSSPLDALVQGKLIRHPGKTLSLYSLVSFDDIQSDIGADRVGDALLSVIDTQDRSHESIGGFTIGKLKDAIDRNVASLLKGVSIVPAEPTPGAITKLFGDGANGDLGEGLVVIDDFDDFFRDPSLEVGGVATEGDRVLTQPTVGGEAGEFDVAYVKGKNVFIGKELVPDAVLGAGGNDVAGDASYGIDVVPPADCSPVVAANVSFGIFSEVDSECRYEGQSFYACPGECSEGLYDNPLVRKALICNIGRLETRNPANLDECAGLPYAQSDTSTVYRPWLDDDGDGVMDENSVSAVSLLLPNGKKTLIVDGGNIIIGTNVMYGVRSDDRDAPFNANSFGLIVRHSDEEDDFDDLEGCDPNIYIGDKRRGGNIFVSPAVTNIDGTYYSEGVMLSMDARVGNSPKFGFSDTESKRWLSQRSSLLKSLRYHNSDDECSSDGYYLNKDYSVFTGPLGDYPDCFAHSSIGLSDPYYSDDINRICLNDTALSGFDELVPALYPASEYVRSSQLRNQLYIRGSVVTGQSGDNALRNTWNGSNSYEVTDDEYELRKALDIAKMREYQIQESGAQAINILPAYENVAVIIEKDNKLSNPAQIPPGFDVFGVEYKEK